jgi:hypothetical protein
VAKAFSARRLETGPHLMLRHIIITRIIPNSNEGYFPRVMLNAVAGALLQVIWDADTIATFRHSARGQRWE